MSQETEDKLNGKGPRMWKCGDDFANPIPAGTGKDSDSEISDKNHWKVVFDAYRDEDQKQCELWKDEVNILLIFAGLFSAVVTAFLIESYKFLLPQGGSDPSKFVPGSPHVIRLNSLWFCSLVLALSTVVIGIVALQWIRNHQRYHGIKPRDALSVYEMRTKALRAWHIRWAFLSLPLLILVALVLFFVGLVDFLLTLNKEVAAPVGVLVYATLTILFITTVLPSLQIFKLYFFPPNVKADIDMPTPCPYKSPQSWIFHRSLILTMRGFRYVTRKLRKVNAAADIVSLPDMPLYFTFHASPVKWTDYDTKWLRLRDMYSQNMEGNHKQDAPFASVSIQHPRRPIYDEAQILIQTVSTLNPSADVLFAAYHCFQEISKNALYQDIESKEDYAAPKYDERNLILRGYYWKHLTLPSSPDKPLFGPPISDLVESPSAHLLHEENMLVFLEMHTSHNLPEEASRVISAHLSELHARILAYAYATEPALHILTPQVGALKGARGNSAKFPWLHMMSQQYIDMINSTNVLPKFKIWSQFAPNSLNGNEVSVSTGTLKKAIIQYSLIFKSFVQHVAESEYLDWESTVYAHRNVAQFFKVPATMLRYTGTDQIPFDVFSRFEKSFEIIQTALSDPPTPDPGDTQSMDEKRVDQANADYLFLSACFFVEQLFNPYSEQPLKPFKEKQCERMADFIKALHAYEQAANYPPVRIQDNWQDFWKDTGLPNLPRFDCKPEPARRSYIRWKVIPTWIEVDLTTPIA
ncbi:hypothetical protein D9619_011358 [Psilocybe cf. subviscida]|uniref:DUF6535 domain-containing protein n=1 Tax=Psilocybe cf. subviscida TaxID=2480587 RepID=A0A8H5F5G7_9AGAR|nr:hypothetical protein D9619_011358 [Psilocybe cf. subviscida]